jgi:hypothetical protein
MLYYKGPTATALVRVTFLSATDSLECKILNNGVIVNISRTTDATIMTGITSLETSVTAVTGAFTMVSGASELR